MPHHEGSRLSFLSRQTYRWLSVVGVMFTWSRDCGGHPDIVSFDMSPPRERRRPEVHTVHQIPLVKESKHLVSAHRWHYIIPTYHVIHEHQEG